MIGGKLLSASAAVQPTYIEDVFSTYLYTGNGATQTINNGIDLAGEGGLVWTKNRDAAQNHMLIDTVKGLEFFLNSNTNGPGASINTTITSVSSNGYTLGNFSNVNGNTSKYASWTFRQAPRFFDVVTYTGTGANRTIAHDLGVVPGCIIVKKIDTSDWQVYHRSNANTEYLVLNSTAAKATGATRWNSTTPTSSVFSLGTDATVNASGGTYVAYLFAHDPLGPSGDGSDGLIACGEVGTFDVTVNLGWEPQWILYKRANGLSDWYIFDTMRGLTYVFNGVNYLLANTSAAETQAGTITPITNGFVSNLTGSYIYIAIRRGPMREPTVGTEVFSPLAVPASTSTSVAAPFPPDLVFSKYRTTTTISSWTDRLRGLAISSANNVPTLKSESTAAEAFSPHNAYYNNNTFYLDSSGAGVLGYFFRRAPGFFDVVAYSGSTSNQNIKHNLGVTPELLIIKVRNSTNSWPIYNKDSGVSNVLYLNQTWGNGSTTRWNSTVPTETQFTLKGSESGSNTSGENYIAYLFASLPGISKVGSYTGNGSSQTINCGFTTGARFILIKRTDSTGDWYVWDTARGIVSGNDPRLSLNTTAAEVTSDDTIDPDNSGFIVNQVSATNVNVSAATYIYLAIA